MGIGRRTGAMMATTRGRRGKTGARGRTGPTGPAGPKVQRAEILAVVDDQFVEVRLTRLAAFQPANNFLAIHRASRARCGPSTSAPATAPSNSTTSARAVAFGSFTPAAVVHSRKRSANHAR